MNVRELTRAEIEAFLAAHWHGRLAYSFRDRVDIEPIHYVWDNGWIYGRTAPGTKLTLLQRNPWVAFEIDEVRSQTDWTSVVVKGTVYFVAEEATAAGDAIHERVMQRLLAAFPEENGRMAETRFVLFRIHVDDYRGLTTT